MTASAGGIVCQNKYRITEAVKHYDLLPHLGAKYTCTSFDFEMCVPCVNCAYKY